MNTPVLIIETISFLASGTLFFQVSTPTFLRYFFVFLLLTIVVESSVLVKVGINVILLYNFFSAFEFVFYLFILMNIIQNPRIKKAILHILWIYPVSVVVNVFLFQVNVFHSITYTIGCLLTVASCIYYFLEIFRKPGSINLLREPAFWLCTGLLFYYTCSFLLLGLYNYIQGLPKVIISHIYTILTIMNFLLYILFSIAFLCRIKIRRRMLDVKG